jgi:CheY-like chemotaxis protein
MKTEINNILLIDDDQDDRFFFSTALGEVDPNIRLATAAEGAEALEKLKKLKPDLILLDLVMPVMNGVGFLKEFSKRREFSGIPLVIYTSALGVYDPVELKKMGASEVWLKAEDFDGTVRKIQEILGKNVYLQSA